MDRPGNLFEARLMVQENGFTKTKACHVKLTRENAMILLAYSMLYF